MTSSVCCESGEEALRVGLTTHVRFPTKQTYSTSNMCALYQSRTLFLFERAYLLVGVTEPL
jgi:hypothetical protein